MVAVKQMRALFEKIRLPRWLPLQLLSQSPSESICIYLLSHVVVISSDPS